MSGEPSIDPVSVIARLQAELAETTAAHGPDALSGTRSCWARLVAPSAELSDPGDRRRARLLAALLLVVIGAGSLSGLAQLLLVPDFWLTFATIAAAMVALGVLQAAARTRHYRASAVIAALVILLACAGVGLSNPEDPSWFAFMMVSVVLGSLFLSLRATAGIAAAALASCLGVLAATGRLEPGYAIPALMFHGMMSPLLLVAAHHSAQLSAERQRTLEESNRRLSDSQRLAAMGHWTWAPRSDHFAGSQQLRALLDCQPSGPRGLATVLGLLEPQDIPQVEAALTLALRGERPPAVALQLLSEGGQRHALLHIEPAGSPGEPLIFGTMQDVTEERRLKDELDRGRRLEIIGRLSGGVAHDFNNLLAVVQTNAELLLEGATDPEDQQSLEEILESVAVGSALTSQLVGFVRRKVLAPTSIDINAILGALEGILARLLGKQGALELSLDPELGLIRADPSQVDQILLNLVVNARDAMPEGGSLRVETKGEPTPTLIVTDEGVGMDPETRSRIFDPFFTTKCEGSGMGLATVYGIVQQLGGHIQVESHLGRGTRFQLEFPLAAPRAGGAGAAPVAWDRRGLLGSRVLLVDDNAALGRVLAQLLRAEGCAVTQAASGCEALRTWGACAGAYDLVILDVMMPELGGPELCGQLRREAPALPVVFISGVPAALERAGAACDGAHALLQKPFTPAALLEAAGALLRDSTRLSS